MLLNCRKKIFWRCLQKKINRKKNFKGSFHKALNINDNTFRSNIFKFEWDLWKIQKVYDWSIIEQQD